MLKRSRKTPLPLQLHAASIVLQLDTNVMHPTPQGTCISVLMTKTGKVELHGSSGTIKEYVSYIGVLLLFSYKVRPHDQ